MNKTVAHLTSVHSRNDTRIFLKECAALVGRGYHVSLVVADGMGDEVKGNIHILDAGPSRGRMSRLLLAPKRVLVRALSVNAGIYHLHDPELLAIAKMLRREGKKVIFDAHEDLPKQVLSKHYIWRPLRSFISRCVAIYERWICRRLDAVVAATPAIRDKFLKINPNTIDVNNYPLLEESSNFSHRNGQQTVCYVGGISEPRGIVELVSALPLTSSGARLQLAGSFMSGETETKVRGMPGWALVDELGWLDRAGIAKAMGQSAAGLVTLRPTDAYLESLPVKMFEYMNAGLPVIASDFPLWRHIIEGSACGLCVNPLDPGAIAGAIDWILEHPDEARQMGENGKRAVREKFNWRVEEAKLIDLYQAL